MSVVVLETSEPAPPMTPARLVAFLASATTSSSWARTRFLPSRVVSSSLGLAQRISSAWPSSLARSKAWQGLPSSKLMKLVTSTTLLMERWPTDSSFSRSQVGLGAILTPLITLAVKRGQASGTELMSLRADVGAGELEIGDLKLESLSLRPVLAATSRAAARGQRVSQ